jgi:hypothetical protein
MAQRASPRSQAVTVPIRRLLITDALTSWVVTTAAVVALVAAVLLNTLGLLADAPSATIVVLALLAIAAHMIVTPFFDPASEHPAVPWPVLVVAAVLWTIVLYLPFHARLFAGPPITQLRIDPNVHDTVVPVAGGTALDRRRGLSRSLEQHDRSVVYDLDLSTTGSHSHYPALRNRRTQAHGLGRRGTAFRALTISTAHVVTDPGAANLHHRHDQRPHRCERVSPPRLPSPALTIPVPACSRRARSASWWAHPRDTPMAATHRDRGRCHAGVHRVDCRSSGRP